MMHYHAGPAKHKKKLHFIPHIYFIYISMCISLFICVFQHGCGNFIRVVQPYNRTHLFMCGSGAYSPVCVYVNRGRRPEVGINEGSASLEKQTREGVNVFGNTG